MVNDAAYERMLWSSHYNTGGVLDFSDYFAIKLGMMLILLSMSITVSGQAASFDCSKATTKIEKMICSDLELSKLDDELAETYRNAMKMGDQTETTKSTQKIWLKERNLCEEIRCLKSAYLARMATLNQLEQQVSTVVQDQSPASPSSEKNDEDCLAPKIDWRNYEWILITGNGKTACEEMLVYLKSRPKDQPPPVCAEDRLPPNGNWTRPEWKEVSPELRERFISSAPKKKPLPNDLYHPSSEISETLSNTVLKVAYTDISGDGIPEYLLAIISKGWLERCRTSPYCASQDSLSKGYIWLMGSLSYELLPLNVEGTEINWQHRAIGSLGLVVGSGELIYYKKRPYWLTSVDWNQSTQDKFRAIGFDPNNATNNTFQLAPLIYRNLKNPPTFNTVTSTNFANAIEIANDQFATCDFGYFHRNNLKQHPPTTRR